MQSPLQDWRDEYGFISESIRQLKRSSRSGHVWGTFKVPRQQRVLEALKDVARAKMQERNEARDAARDLYNRRHNQKRPKLYVVA